MTTITEGMVEAAIKKMLLEVSEQLTENDRHLIERAKNLMEELYVHGYHQLYTIGEAQPGEYFEGLQLDGSIGQNSICAEVSAIEKAIRANVRLTTVITVHQKRVDEGGDVHVVTPCAMCIERYLQYFPSVRVLVWFNGEVRKVHIRALIALPYKRRIRPNGNGNSTAKFHD